MARTFYWSSVSSNDPTNTANWTRDDGTTGNLPATGDVAVVGALQSGTAAAISTTTSQAAITLAALYIDASHTTGIGSSSSYWSISAQNVFVGRGAGVGSGRIKLNLGGVASKIYVFGTNGTSSDVNRQVARFTGTNAANEVYVASGSVGLAASTPGELSNFATIIAAGSQSSVVVGGGVTWSLVQCRDGAVTINAPAPAGSLAVISGTVNTQFVGSIGTATLIGGTANLNHRDASGADLGYLEMRGGGVSWAGNPDGFAITQTNDGGGSMTVATPNQVNFGTMTPYFGTAVRRTLSLGAA